CTRITLATRISFDVW
nr:immunoglobulin heavy chain junction region [Macaca mulatta]